jgi:hypothetical protein
MRASSSVPRSSATRIARNLGGPIVFGIRCPDGDQSWPNSTAPLDNAERPALIGAARRETALPTWVDRKRCVATQRTGIGPRYCCRKMSSLRSPRESCEKLPGKWGDRFQMLMSQAAYRVIVSGDGRVSNARQPLETPPKCHRLETTIFAALIRLRSPACLTHHKHRCRVSARDRIATQQR